MTSTIDNNHNLISEVLDIIAIWMISAMVSTVSWVKSMIISARKARNVWFLEYHTWYHETDYDIMYNIMVFVWYHGSARKARL